jgi:hypothetical protein
VLSLVLVYITPPFNSESFVKTKSQVLEKDASAYLYKMQDRGSFWFVASNKMLDAEMVSENAFWSPEHCASMLTLEVLGTIYFFESKFKQDSSNEFYDVVYKYDVRTNMMETFESTKHLNLYSAILKEGKIFVFYQEGDEFYKAELIEKENSLDYTNKQKISESEIEYNPWKGEIESLEKINDNTFKYFVIQKSVYTNK